jgi:alpha-ketoglutarate-dependent taurine dioxygenase
MGELPFVITSNGNRDLASWACSNRSWVDSALQTHGALLFRGFAVAEEGQFADAVRSVSLKPLEYIYRSTPRTQVAPGIYTATEYPAGQKIPLHNENSYQRDWPLRLIFACLTPAASGGETPLASTVRVTQRIDPKIREKAMEKGILYIRNYSEAIDLSWRVVFQTDSAAEVESYCRDHGINCEWINGEWLRTSQVCQAMACHPLTGDWVWFNQAHLFHVSSLSRATRTAMLEMLPEDRLPRSACYGDGEPLEEATLENIRQAFDEEARTFGWQPGDVLLVDNMLVSHGRNPFKGKRRVLAAMSDPYSSVLQGVPGSVPS